MVVSSYEIHVWNIYLYRILIHNQHVYDKIVIDAILKHGYCFLGKLFIIPYVSHSLNLGHTRTSLINM